MIKQILHAVSIGLIVLSASFLQASVWTDYWTEDPNDPIYANQKWPFVLYDNNNFSGHGSAHPYKMWSQIATTSALALSYSDDGVTWILESLLVFDGGPISGHHPCVVYDPNGFGGAGYYYRLWFWNGVATDTSASAIQCSTSVNGLNWTAPVPAQQDPLSPIAVGISGQWFYHLYGPGHVTYDPTHTFIPSIPHDYIMYFHTSTEGGGPDATIEQTGLAYSDDGITWTRYGTEPVVIPSGSATDWDGNYAYDGTVFKARDGVFHMFYSGSNSLIDPMTSVPYAHGIGHATSADGVNWTFDPDNPVFIYSDGVPWRSWRTYTPTVVYAPFCDSGSTDYTVKMWFTGGIPSSSNVGYATMPCPLTPPSYFRGLLWVNQFLNRTVCGLRMTWDSCGCGASGYRIFKDDSSIATIPSTVPMVYDLCIGCWDPVTGYEIASVNESEGLESDRIPLTLECGRPC